MARFLLALGLTSPRAFAQAMDRPERLYDVPPFGDVTLLFSTDLHAQLRPHHFMEPPNLLAPKPLEGRPGYLAGEAMLRYYGIRRGSLEAYVFSSVDFAALAQRFGPMGGGAHIGTLIRRQRAAAGERRTLVLDGGDNWTNSGISLLTKGQVMVDWMNRVGFDHMVFHWEYTLGRPRVEELVKELKAQVVSFNIVDDLFGDPIYEPYRIHEIGGYSLAIIGSTFPYVKVSHPEEFSEGLSFGVREKELQRYVDELRGKGVDAIVLLSHNGVPLDSAIAERVSGIDLILTGHTHDYTPRPARFGNTWLVAGGAAGKAVVRVDLKLRKGGIQEIRQTVLPVASNLIQPDADLVEFVEGAYAPHKAYLDEVLGTAETLIYKRDSTYSTFDELSGRAIQAFYPEVEVAFSPGTRWGTAILPGQPITMDRLLAYTAFTYPEVYVFKLKGERLLAVLEDVAANAFNPDPFYQQGGDMSRVYGLAYDLAVNAPTGQRIRNVAIRGRRLDPNREYVVAAYGGRLQRSGTILEKYTPRPIYDIMAEYIRQLKTVSVPPRPSMRVLDHRYVLPG
ncbi:MAG: thiosulfohydrolase SoxB [Meiothermus sp.]|uniref:thiosulfohydrolase SoxB n=1 Tax=Meiothermus sp. TaxID=1955249 RepID=UPI0025EA09A9|nr:thiosulfohydrolase SoxB [Meiothermus sp.]MCS7194052.1 thiosulfohydrolase SoxB [Meiothermus sp.]MCX7740423.1 thiosulfohydrolase SoxB [Meiothermus sp.]MDW8091172.1 thiosulfohydrolase SoxB [Meiothermus sp.]